MHARAVMFAAVLALGPWTPGSGAAQETTSAADLNDFKLETARQLADLCAVDEGDPLYTEASMFCYGVLEGIAQYHEAIARGPEGERIVCPEEAVTRDEYVQTFLDWAEAHPDVASSAPPADSVIAAALERWGPCEE
jgi:Rap1a immunity proteins